MYCSCIQTPRYTLGLLANNYFFLVILNVMLPTRMYYSCIQTPRYTLELPANKYFFSCWTQRYDTDKNVLFMYSDTTISSRVTGKEVSFFLLDSMLCYWKECIVHVFRRHDILSGYRQTRFLLYLQTTLCSLFRKFNSDYWQASLSSCLDSTIYSWVTGKQIFCHVWLTVMFFFMYSDSAIYFLVTGHQVFVHVTWYSPFL